MRLAASSTVLLAHFRHRRRLLCADCDQANRLGRTADFAVDVAASFSPSFIKTCSSCSILSKTSLGRPQPRHEPSEYSLGLPQLGQSIALYSAIEHVLSHSIEA